MDLDELLRFVDEVVFSTAKRHLRDVELLILKGSWQSQNYEEIAEAYGYADKYLKQDVGFKLWHLLSEVFGERVSKTNFRSTLERHWQRWKLTQAADQPSVLSSRVAWRSDVAAAIDVSRFYGRAAELAVLQQQMGEQNCRVMALVGMSGVGKTALAAKFVQQMEKTTSSALEGVIWRSLRHAPPITEMVTELLQFVSNSVALTEESSFDQQISHLLRHLRQQRYLLVLDDWESLLQEGELAGHCMKEHGGYSRLLQRLAEESHKSCLLVISRELPIELATMTGEDALSVLKLKGLPVPDAEALLIAKGLVSNQPGLTELIQLHRGNPAALKIAGTTIQELFEGDITQFLAQTSLALGDILLNRLDQQFERLSDIEKRLMYQLGGAGEAVSMTALKEDAIGSRSELLSALESLRRRSLLERHTELGEIWFSLEPVVLKYVTQQLIAQVCQEIRQALQMRSLEPLHLLSYQPIFGMANVKQRHSQRILERVQAKLGSALGGNIAEVEAGLIDLLALLPKSQALPNCAEMNLTRLMQSVNPS